MAEILKFLTDNMFLIILFFVLCGGGIAAFFQRILERRHLVQREQAMRDHEYRVLVERRKLAESLEKLVDAVLVDKVLADDFDRRFHARQEDKGAVPPTRVRVEPAAAPDASEPDAPLERKGAAARGPRRRNDG